MKLEAIYCASLTQYSRFKTQQVSVGNIALGAENPIRVQSMTNTNTADAEATAAQTMLIFDAGADFVRITTPTVKDAENLEAIKALLTQAGYHNPLVADVHFNPKAAETAAQLIEKVRINPGNFVDSKRFKEINFTEEEYAAELQKIEEKLVPLLNICKIRKVVLRIGTNHGSLSDRIMSRFGDTPEGMVEAAMEFLRICVNHNFTDCVVSLKASNTRIMVQAYRLLVIKMTAEGMNFPLHLGVTEAGEGEDGRIKSAVGIGTLLADGLGDTIRVSLTEAPEAEIPVAKFLVQYMETKQNHQAIKPLYFTPQYNPVSYLRFSTLNVQNIGSINVPVVITALQKNNPIKNQLQELFKYSGGKFNKTDLSPDYLYVGSTLFLEEIPVEAKYLYDYSNETKDFFAENSKFIPIFTLSNFDKSNGSAFDLFFLKLTYAELNSDVFLLLKNNKNAVIMLSANTKNSLAEQRAAMLTLAHEQAYNPVVLCRNYEENEVEKLQLKAGVDLGGLFIDGLGDGIFLQNTEQISVKNLSNTAFGILQACRVRVSKTEFISCPSCGRTLFDLQETTAKVRAKTKHLKGLKIAVMGCIVNGPGEMADADFGYVGAGPDKITLYKGKEVVKRSIDANQAVDELVQLIKDNNRWVEPE
ncbi:MAG TPA: 4-hydroxy-3-methylbut-2-en-1-yl diphosphate synthase [Bacteroidales bacterium]|nr:4-hydroxy-3-methylbut-2-en-1-yl diphosphate synthase [Bacteroidales bacterium]